MAAIRAFAPPHRAPLIETMAIENWATTSGSWNILNDWNPIGVPGLGDTAIVGVAASYTVSVSGNQSAGELELAGGAADVVVAPGSTLSVGTLAVDAGTLTVDGTVETTLGGSITLANGLIEISGVIINSTGIIAAGGEIELVGTTGAHYRRSRAGLYPCRKWGGHRIRGQP